VVLVVGPVIFLLEHEIIVVNADFNIVVDLVRETVVCHIQLQDSLPVDVLRHLTAFWERHVLLINLFFYVTNWLN
jgi:hypothetical protein